MIVIETALEDRVGNISLMIVFAGHLQKMHGDAAHTPRVNHIPPRFRLNMLPQILN